MMGDPRQDPQEGDVITGDGVFVHVDMVRDGWVFYRRDDGYGGFLGAARCPLAAWQTAAAEGEVVTRRQRAEREE